MKVTIKQLHQVAGYKIYMQKSVVFSYTNNKHVKNKIKKAILPSPKTNNKID